MERLRGVAPRPLAYGSRGQLRLLTRVAREEFRGTAYANENVVTRNLRDYTEGRWTSRAELS
jgi:hypothetical protein